MNLWPAWLRRLLCIGDAVEDDPVAEFIAREADDDRTRFHAQMRAGGYREWIASPPVGRDVVECQREEWSRGSWRGAWVIRPAECDPLMNVADLWWRDVGGVVDVDGEASADRRTGTADAIHRNDFHFIAYCRHCGKRSRHGDGYADAMYQRCVFPARHCEHCGCDEYGNKQPDSDGEGDA
jgi:hypothetical protein